LRKDVITVLSELAITQAYMRLLFASPNEDGSKMVSLARIGKYEVLLAAFAQRWAGRLPLCPRHRCRDRQLLLQDFDGMVSVPSN